MPKTWAIDLKGKLKASKNYLKTDYKVHITDESRCADHCRAHALSDSIPEFQQKCFHEHNEICDRCESLEGSLAEIEVAVSSEQVQLRYTFNRLRTKLLNNNAFIFCCRRPLPFTFSYYCLVRVSTWENESVPPHNVSD